MTRVRSAVRFAGWLLIGWLGAVPGAWPQQLPAADPDPQWIRVAVVQQEPAIDVAVSGRFRMVAVNAPLNEASLLAPGAAGPLREGNRLPTLSIRAEGAGLRIGDEVVPVSSIVVQPVRDATVSLNGQRLRGLVEIRRQDGSTTLLVINHVELEDYLRGVLSKEAPYQWPIEALKAIAVAARTYAVFQRMTADAATTHDVSGDVLSQVYGGRSAERSRTSRAVDETRGLILTYQGQVFPAFYHSTCGGVTERGTVMGLGPFDLEPLKGGLQCSFCVDSPFFRWQRRLSKADVAWAVKKLGRGSIWPVEAMRIAQYTATGRVAAVRIRGGGRTLDLSGHEFRQALGFSTLRSTGFAIIPEGDGFILQGRGWGHGVGLCQWGVAELARRGMTAKEILALYYPGATLMRLGERVVKPVVVEQKTRR